MTVAMKLKIVALRVREWRDRHSLFNYRGGDTLVAPADNLVGHLQVAFLDPTFRRLTVYFRYGC